MKRFYIISISWTDGSILKHRTTHGTATGADCSGCRYLAALHEVSRQGKADPKKVSVTNYFEGPSCDLKHEI